MKIIVNIYYRNRLVDAQAHTIRKKKGRACPLDIDIDAAVDNTVGPDQIAAAVREAAQKVLTRAAREHHQHTRPTTKSG